MSSRTIISCRTFSGPRWSYEVIRADNGYDGLAAVEREAISLGGLVTDVNLGSTLNGWMVADRARELNSRLPAIYVTGDDAREWAARGAPDKIQIIKPFDQSEVVAALDNLRNQAEARI